MRLLTLHPHQLSSNSPLPDNSVHFMDDHLLGCGGRTHNSRISQTAKFPILLPSKHTCYSECTFRIASRWDQCYLDSYMYIVEILDPLWKTACEVITASKCDLSQYSGKPIPDPPAEVNREQHKAAKPSCCE